VQLALEDAFHQREVRPALIWPASVTEPDAWEVAVREQDRELGLVALPGDDHVGVPDMPGVMPPVRGDGGGEFRAPPLNVQIAV
jgi:hypothetical protein